MDSSQLKFEKLSWSPLVQIVILCAGTLISFIVAYGNGDVSVYLPFISETGAEVPQMCLFSLTLIFGSGAGTVVICYRNLIMRHLLLNSNSRLKKLNGISTIIGLISMAGLAGVAAFPMSTVLWAHLLAAVIHFSFAMIYIILQTFINHYVPGSNRWWNRLRAILCAMLLLFLFLLVIFFPLSFFKWKKVNTHPPAIKKPDDQVFGIMFCSAFFEWMMYGIFMTYMLTLLLEFRKFHLTIGVVPVPEKPQTAS